MRITYLRVPTPNQFRAAHCKIEKAWGKPRYSMNSSDLLLASCLVPGWGALPTIECSWTASRRKVRSQPEDYLNSGLITLFCIYPSCLLSKQTSGFMVTAREFAQRVCSSLSEGFYSGNCKTWVRKGVKWIIYKLDMELICRSQKPVKAHILTVSDVSFSFVDCTAMQTLN